MYFFEEHPTRAEREKADAEYNPVFFTDKVIYTIVTVCGIFYVIFILVIIAAVVTANA